MIPIFFESSVVGKASDGKISIALMDGLEAPHAGERVCVAILTCDPAAAAALVENVSSVLNIE